MSWRRWRLRWFPPRCAGGWRLPAKRDDFHLFVLAGQSNMAGHGCVRQDDPWQDGDFAPVQNTWVLGGQCGAKSARPRGWIRWRPAAHPLHLSQASAGFGLGLEFACVYGKHRPGTGIGLIPCAWGGAGIDAFGPDQPLRLNLVRRCQAAARRGVLTGVLWHQGETDTMDETLAASHEAKLRELLLSLRAELASEHLLFAIGDLSPALAAAKERSDQAWATRIARVREGLRRVATTDPHAVWVASDDLPGVARDVFHFDRDALVEIGGRYARAVITGGVHARRV